MTLPPPARPVGGSGCKNLCGLADAAGPVLTHKALGVPSSSETGSQPSRRNFQVQCMKGNSWWLEYNLKSFLNFKSIYLGNSNTEILEKYIIDRQTEEKEFTEARELHPVRGTGGDSSLLSCFSMNRSGSREVGSLSSALPTARHWAASSHPFQLVAIIPIYH